MVVFLGRRKGGRDKGGRQNKRRIYLGVVGHPCEIDVQAHETESRYCVCIGFARSCAATCGPDCVVCFLTSFVFIHSDVSKDVPPSNVKGYVLHVTFPGGYRTIWSGLKCQDMSKSNHSGGGAPPRTPMPPGGLAPPGLPPGTPQLPPDPGSGVYLSGP